MIHQVFVCILSKVVYMSENGMLAQFIQKFAHTCPEMFLTEANGLESSVLCHLQNKSCTRVS